MFLHVSVIHSFLLSDNIPLYMYSIVYLPNSPGDGHLACFQVLAVMKKAAMLWPVRLSLLDHCPVNQKVRAYT